MSDCIECDAALPLHEDPRTPPLAVGPCLCLDCAKEAHDIVVADQEDELENAKSNRDALYEDDEEPSAAMVSPERNSDAGT